MRKEKRVGISLGHPFLFFFYLRFVSLDVGETLIDMQASEGELVALLQPTMAAVWDSLTRYYSWMHLRTAPMYDSDPRTYVRTYVRTYLATYHSCSERRNNSISVSLFLLQYGR